MKNQTYGDIKQDLKSQIEIKRSNKKTQKHNPTFSKNKEDDDE